MAQHHCSAVGGLQCFLDIVIPICYGSSWRYLVTDIPKALLSIPFTGMMRIACFHIEWVTSSVFFYKELLGSLPSGGRSWLGTSPSLGGRMLHHIDDMFLVGLELETILCWTPEFSSLMTSDGKESACNAGDLGSIPGLGKISWRERLPTPISLPGEFHGQRL